MFLIDIGLVLSIVSNMLWLFLIIGLFYSISCLKDKVKEQDRINKALIARLDKLDPENAKKKPTKQTPLKDVSSNDFHWED